MSDYGKNGIKEGITKVGRKDGITQVEDLNKAVEKDTEERSGVDRKGKEEEEQQQASVLAFLVELILLVGLGAIFIVSIQN